jgi:hypothetical protein
VCWDIQAEAKGKKYGVARSKMAVCQVADFGRLLLKLWSVQSAVFDRWELRIVDSETIPILGLQPLSHSIPRYFHAHHRAMPLAWNPGM